MTKCYISHHGLCFIFDNDRLTFYLVPKDTNPDEFQIKDAEGIQARSALKNLVAVVNVENTSGCNLACEYCFGEKKHLKPRNMDLKTAKRTIDFFYDHFKKNFNVKELYIDFTGAGEPLLNFKLINQIVKYVLSKKAYRNVYLRFTTNATLFNKDIIKKIKGYLKKRKRILHFSVSLDGPPNINDEVRKYKNGNGTSDIVLKNLMLLEKEKLYNLIDNVDATYTFDKPFLVYRLEYLNLIGFKEVVMKPYRGLDGRFCITPERLELIKQEYHSLANFLILKILKENDYDYLFSILNPGDMFGKFILRVFAHSRQCRRCNAGYISYFVDYKGDIFLCPSFGGAKETLLGNVFRGFDQSSPKFKGGFFDECEKCWAKYICGGECMYDTYIRSSSSPNKLLCELKIFLIKEAAYLFGVLSLKKPQSINRIQKFLNKKKRIFFE